jgi:hypothetical protein
MKNKLKVSSLFLILAIVSCISINKTTGQLKNVSAQYYVYKIDSINNYYLIYAKKTDSLYKIVSKKEKIRNCDFIHIGQSYGFVLESVWNHDIIINGKNVSPRMTPHIECVGFDNVTSICLEKDSINDLHIAKNVRGLCLIE